MFVFHLFKRGQVEAPLHASHLRSGALCGGESAGTRLATLEALWMAAVETPLVGRSCVGWKRKASGMEEFALEATAFFFRNANCP